jgi:hypothetical protein
MRLVAQTDSLITAELLCAKRVENNRRLLVTLEVNRKNVKSFARFTQKLDHQFKVESVQLESATMHRENGILRFNWLDMPGNPKFNVTYQIIIPEKYIGDLVLGGKFEYVLNEEPVSVELKPVIVKIGRFQ